MPSSFFDNVPVGIPLSQYTNAITNAVASARELAGVWIIAELSDVRLAGGHCYMELIEKNETGQTIAKLRATIWRNSYYSLRQKFFSATNREISNGIKALVRGSATHHSIYGLSFNIVDIDPSYTMGDMERIRKEILMRLHKEGVALYNKNLSLPLAPQKIAVISAEGAAGYGDFINHLCGNSEGFVFYPCLFPCIMQGDKVSESIRKALRIIESTAHIWDCVAIVRGGGATTDLNGFDDYELARAVATCGLPVVVGIGHERDRNVLDEIAHTSLKTPTAVAGFFIDQARSAYDKVLTLADRLRIYSTDLLRGEERRLSTIQGFIPQLSLRRLEEAKSSLQSISGILPLLIEGRLGKERIRLDGMKTILGNITGARIVKENLKIDNLLLSLKNFSASQINYATQKINNLEALTKVLDPKNTLKRGYSITRINGKAVKTKGSIFPGYILTTTLSDGEIRSLPITEEER
ncbi:MAG: exodeoxyribonuclease VII large subunit [Muribaculaceae bacterium]|nr:exodeoxyribonuclease VII large subunit [Muribaculaceae bacterium]